jgi:peptidoglycan/xylan/chitin deacetylase (PgdA/CDA1 family)
MATEAPEVIKPNCGVFTISLDFEMIWGTQDLFGPERFRKACEIERTCVIDRLLDLLVEYELPATWFVVGHLMLDRCAAASGLKHPEIVRPLHSWMTKDWFEHDPGGCEEDGSIFLGRSLVEKIRACPVPQEIGCHTFSHVVLGDPGCSRPAAVSELKACVELAGDLGIEMVSFAFPRNKVGHLELLRDYGFSCYRGPEPEARIFAYIPGGIKRLANLWRVLTASEPPVGLPEKTESGLWMIPGSMVYFPMHGLRRYIPVRARTRRAIKGLDAAARKRRVFHLWFHPTNLAEEMERMFAGLRGVVEYASLLRANGQLDFLPMGSLAQSSTPAFASTAGNSAKTLTA